MSIYCDYNNDYDKVIIQYDESKTIELSDALCVDIYMESDELINSYLYGDNDIVDSCEGEIECLLSANSFSSKNYTLQIEYYNMSENHRSTDFFIVSYNVAYENCIEQVIYLAFIILILFSFLFGIVSIVICIGIICKKRRKKYEAIELDENFSNTNDGEICIFYTNEID